MSKMSKQITIKNKERIKEESAITEFHRKNYKEECKKRGIKPTELKSIVFKSFNDTSIG